MKVRTIALLVSALTVAVPAMTKADVPAVVIGNLEPRPLPFQFRCAGYATPWHNFTLGVGQYRWFSADDWHGDCAGQYEMLIGTDQRDGSSVGQIVSMTVDHTYLLVKTRTVGYTAHDAQYMIVVKNASSEQVDLNYFCANVGSKQMSLAPYAQSWLFVGSPAACSPYYGSIRQAGRELATLPTTPLPTGNVYTLTWNSDRNMWNISRAQAQSLATN